MSKLLELREKLNLTQEELAKKAKISVRTIQRVESGAEPKGYTLEALSKALGVPKTDLLTKENESDRMNKNLLKYINLSSILLLVIPFGSIVAPLLVMFWKKEFNTITKKIVSIQILWTVSTFILVFASSFLKNWFSLSNQVTSFTILVLIILNLSIILRNTLELERSNKLFIDLKFSLL